MRNTPSEWLADKGADFVRRAYGEREFTEANDREVADYLSPFMALDGVHGQLTSAIVGKVRSRLGVVAKRSPRPRPEATPPAATLPFPEPASGAAMATTLARIVALLTSIDSGIWATERKLERLLAEKGIAKARVEDEKGSVAA